MFYLLTALCDDSDVSLTVSLPVVIVFLVLLLAFALAIVILSLVVVKQKKKKTQLTAIPKILESRAINNTCDVYGKKRPKSTNLEFLNSTGENKYTSTVSHVDTDCIRPLMSHSVSTNEYVHC